MSDLSHLVQDLRAGAHRCPEDLRPLIRNAAAELERRSALILDLVGAPRPCPIPPPAIDEEEEATTCA